MSTNERLIPGESIHWLGMAAAGRWQWWVRQSWRMRDHFNCIRKGGRNVGEYVSFPLSVDCLRGVSGLCSFLPPPQDVPQGNGGGWRKRGMKVLGKLEKSSLGHMQAWFDQVLKEEHQLQACFRKVNFLIVSFFSFLQICYTGKSVEKLTSDKQFPFANFFFFFEKMCSYIYCFQNR